MISVALASTLFGLTAARLGGGYDAGVIETTPLVLGIIAFVVLVIGGHLGGVLVFRYGAKVGDASDPASPPGDSERIAAS